MISTRARALLLSGVVLLVAACGGAASTNDPSGAVQAALGAASGGITKLADFTCAAKKNDVTDAFGASSLSQLQGAGVNMNDLFGAVSIKFENVTTKETSKSDSAATVHMTADMTISFDKDKMKALMKTVLQAQGQPVDDAALDNLMAMMSTQLSQSQKLDEDVSVVNEGGKWLLCG
jgi:hypothetical protein